MRPITDLFDKRILFVTGKGGVGKTTVALALGVAAAAAGRRTIVCEVAAQESASRIFGKAEIGFHEVELRENLSAISIDPDHSIREYLELQLPVKAMGDLLYRSKIFNYLAAATPGLAEMVTIGKIWELALDERKARRGKPYDLVIVDAPATGHGLGLMQTPKTFAEIARVGPMAHQAATINKTITNHRKAGAILIALPEEMPVNETATLEAELIDSIGIAIDRIYMNAVYPQRFSAAELERIAAAQDDAMDAQAMALAAALDQAKRAAGHAEQLERLRELARTDVAELPFLFAPELGVEELDELAGMAAE
ncbi:MAG TPA: ArsA-related P-loop ATPase [Solirubrobacterales bacterium]|nr:ArsA-related P-loop ATPase [Solirubrobacterales bacterium]